MSQNNSNNKAAMLAVISKINNVDGFDPTPFAVDYTDLVTNETRKRLPVIIQMAWFRLKYPEGKIAVQVTPAKDCFVATAKVYPSYKDPIESYLAEATASRGLCEEKPSISPREWAQTAAVGIALRNAGFGLQFAMTGEDFESVAPDELGLASSFSMQGESEEYAVIEEASKRELTMEEKVEQAMKTVCPIAKFGGKTLGEVLSMDPGAIRWLAEKYTGAEETKEAAKLICEYALQQTNA